MNTIKSTAVAAALSLAALFPIGASAHEITLGNLMIGHPWARQSPLGADVAAGYLTVENKGSEDDRLVKVTAEITPMAQLHTMKMDGDIMKMIELPDGIPVPAGQLVELKPKSLHIMFMKLAKPVAEGEIFKGTLTFEKAGTVAVEFEVMAPDAGMN